MEYTIHTSIQLSIPYIGFAVAYSNTMLVESILSIPYIGFRRKKEKRRVGKRNKLSIPYIGF
jgi:hypothetical protein